VFGRRGDTLHLTLKRGGSQVDVSLVRAPQNAPAGPTASGFMVSVKDMINWQNQFAPCIGAGPAGLAALEFCYGHFKPYGFIKSAELGSTGFEIDVANKSKALVTKVDADSPAEKAGIQPGDEIVAVEGHKFAGLSAEKKIEGFGKLVAAHECAGKQTEGCVAKTPVELTIRRDGQLKTIEASPRYNAEAKKVLIGFSYGGEFAPINTSLAFSRSTGLMGEVISRTGSVFSHIFEAEKRKEISSVVGISDVGHEAVNDGWRKAFILLALVSLSLGLINLVPILPLDGGHIFWAIVEKLRGGKPVSIRVMERATIIGFALVLMLMVIGVSNDIGRITGEGFNVSK